MSGDRSVFLKATNYCFNMVKDHVYFWIAANVTSSNIYIISFSFLSKSMGDIKNVSILTSYAS